MKIGIVTFQRADNYGALLQCYALYKYIAKIEPDTEVIDYRNLVIERRYKQYPRLNRHIAKWVVGCWRAFVQTSDYRKRKNGFEKLRAMIRLSEPRIKEETLDSFRKYDLVFSGSDQILNPRITDGFDDVYYLDAPGDFQKVVYAGSVGNAQDTLIQGQEFLQRILKFDAVSFREDDIYAYVNQKNIRCEKVVDPTFLLSKEEWKMAISRVYTGAPLKYLVLYYVQPDGALVKMAQDLAREKQCAIVYFDSRLHLQGDAVYKGDVGPLEFVRLISDAECIVTSSFHGTAFSAIFRKNVYLHLPRVTGARVRSIAQMCGIEKRIYDTYDDFCCRHLQQEETIEYDEETIDKSIKRSKSFIEGTIRTRKD